MQRASEAQTRLFRRVTRASAELLPDTHGPNSTVDPSPERCDLSMLLPGKFGGFGWTHPVHLVQVLCFTMW